MEVSTNTTISVQGMEEPQPHPLLLGDPVDNGHTPLLPTPIQVEDCETEVMEISPSFPSKKSNLKKRSKYEGGRDTDRYTFLDPTPKPTKRIRIVEDNQELIERLEEELNNCDDDNHCATTTTTTRITKSMVNGEGLTWISLSPRPIDFTLVHLETVRSGRVVVPKVFSVLLENYFIDSDTISPLIDSRVTTPTPLVHHRVANDRIVNDRIVNDRRVNEHYVMKAIEDVGGYNYERLSLDLDKQFLIRRQVEGYRGSQRPPSTTPFIYAANAIKLAGLDAALNFQLVSPSHLKSTPSKNIFYFADMWTESKGFREYILWKSQQNIVKGILVKGFAMRADVDPPKDGFTDSSGIVFSSLPCSSSGQASDSDLAPLPIQLVDHFVGDGTNSRGGRVNLVDIGATDGFVQLIRERTEGRGVHLFVVDNPEHFGVHENVRDVRFQRKLFCQCIVALLAVREGGSFVVKIFDCLTRFTVGLIYLMYRCFERISIHKPHGSPAHSSERFLVCVGKRGGGRKSEVEGVEQFLLRVHSIVVRNEEVRRIVRKKIRRKLEVSQMEVKELVPLRIITSDADFFEYIRHSNITLGRSLSKAILKLCETASVSTTQSSVGSQPKASSLSSIQLIHSYGLSPPRTRPAFSNPLETLHYLMNQPGVPYTKICLPKETGLREGQIRELWNEGESWVACLTQPPGPSCVLKRRGVFLGLGGEEVYVLDSRQSWIPFVFQNLKLTAGTLVYGEIGEDVLHSEEGTGGGRTRPSFNIIEALFINGRFIGHLPFKLRESLCGAYCRVLSQTTVTLRHRTNVLLGDNRLTQHLSSVREVVDCKEHIYTHEEVAENGKSRVEMAVGGLQLWRTTDPHYTSSLWPAQILVLKWKEDAAFDGILSEIAESNL